MFNKRLFKFIIPIIVFLSIGFIFYHAAITLDINNSNALVCVAGTCFPPSPTPTSTPIPTQILPPVISSVTIHDNTQGCNIGNNCSAYLGDSMTATANGSIGNYTWSETETSPGEPTYNNSGNGNSFNFSSNPLTPNPINVSHPKSGESYKISITFHLSNAGGNTSKSSAYSFNFPNVAYYSCLTPGNFGSVLASELNGNLILYNDDPTNGCSTGYYGPPQNIIATPGAYSNAYNKGQKDSIIYYPGSSQIPGCANNSCNNIALVSSLATGNIYAVHWNWNTSTSFNNIVDPASVTVIPVINNAAGNLADLEFDNFGNAGVPDNFYMSSQSGFVWRIPFTNLNNIMQSWASSDFSGNYNPATINSASYLFLDPSSGGSYFNGIKAINGKLYVSMTDTKNNQLAVGVFPALGGIRPAGTILDSGISNQSNFTFWQEEILEGGKAHMDGMTQSPDGKYVYVVSGAGKVIWVIATNNGNPFIVGDTIVRGLINTPPNCVNNGNTSGGCLAHNGGLDGVEVDQSGTMYLSDEAVGVFTINTNDIIKAAMQNSKNIYARNWVSASLYANAKVNIDDIAPLSANGSGSSGFTPYDLTTAGNTYFENGYSLSSLSNMTPPVVNSFSEYNFLSNAPTNHIGAPGMGSAYRWEFQAYASNLNHSNGSVAPVYGYSSLYNELCNQGNACTNNISLPGGPNNAVINSTNSAVNVLKGGVYEFNNSGTLTIDVDNNGAGGLGNMSGILFVKGGSGINIIVDRKNDFNTKNRLVIITTDPITIIPTSNFSNKPGIADQYLTMGIVTDSDVTINAYSGSNLCPNYVQPMQLNGVYISYGNAVSHFNICNFNRTNPAVQFNYDGQIINQISKFFAQSQSAEEIGL